MVDFEMLPMKMEQKPTRYLIKEIINKYYGPSDSRAASYFGLNGLEEYELKKHNAFSDDNETIGNVSEMEIVL